MQLVNKELTEHETLLMKGTELHEQREDYQRPALETAGLNKKDSVVCT